MIVDGIKQVWLGLLLALAALLALLAGGPAASGDGVAAQMDSPFLDAPYPLNIAHRGASSLAPENTLAAARKAWEQGANAWELDTQLPEDGVLIVMHDDTLERTTNLAVGNIPPEELESYRGEPVPTLREALEFIKEHEWQVGAEAYNPGLQAFQVKVAQELQQAGYRIGVWTVDDPDTMEDLIALGVNGIFTNYPQRLRPLVESTREVTWIEQLCPCP